MADPWAAPPNPTPDGITARIALENFLSGIPADARMVCVHDSDADGVSAGVVWQRACERLVFRHVFRVIPDRERGGWTPANRERAAQAHPDRLFVLDIGSRAEPVVPGVPTCVIDHHRPEGVPPGGTLITAYGWDPIPNTSLMVYDLFRERVDLSDLDWVAAIGTISDLGERAPFPVLEMAKRKYAAKYLKEATTLINAARRASTYDPEAAAQALLRFESPRALVESDSPEVDALRRAREEVKAALEEGKKAAPTFAGKVALVRVHSACQIHPLIAQIWRSRLPGYLVVVANDGYLPGRVNFSARSAPGVSVLDFLKGIEASGVLPEGEGTFGHGHDAASGGSLPPARWNALLTAMGFPPSVQVPT